MGITFGKIDTSNDAKNHFQSILPSLLKVLVEHEQPITAIAISEDGKHVLTGDKDGQAIIWSFKDGMHIQYTIIIKKFFSRCCCT